MGRFQLRIDVSCDDVPFATVFDSEGLLDGDWDEFVATRLDKFTIRQLARLAMLVRAGDQEGILSLMVEVDRG